MTTFFPRTVIILEQPPVGDNKKLTAGSIHKTVPPPIDKAHLSGAWVLNDVSVPVRLLDREYDYVAGSEATP